VRVRRAQHQGAQGSLRRVVIGIAALAADQCIVLLAQHALANAELDWGRHLISMSSWLFCRHIAAEKRIAQTTLAMHMGRRPRKAPPARHSGWVSAHSIPCGD